MRKEKAKGTWNMRLMAFAMVLAISSLFVGIHVEANDQLDVGQYKGNKAEKDWGVPEAEGKIFAGWYQDAEFKQPCMDTEGQAYAKFVDANVLTVKKQLKAGTKLSSDKTDIRFLTAIDSLKFKSVTFDVKVPKSNKEWTKTETTAYTSMMVDGQEEPVYPSDTFATQEAKYFVAHSFKNIPNTAFGHTFTVTPSWVTMDGTTVVGKPLEFTINEVLLEGSLFTDKVTVGGFTINSDMSVWNMEDESKGILTVKNGSWGQPMILKGTGTESLLKTRIENITTGKATNNGDGATAAWEVFGGVWVTDGTNMDY